MPSECKQIKRENSPEAAMAASGLLYFGLVCPYPVLKGPI